MKFWCRDLKSFGLNYGPTFYQFFLSKIEKNSKCSFTNNFLIFCHIFMKFRVWIHFLNTNDNKCQKIKKRSSNFTKGCQISQNLDLASTFSFLTNWHVIWHVYSGDSKKYNRLCDCILKGHWRSLEFSNCKLCSLRSKL